MPAKNNSLVKGWQDFTHGSLMSNDSLDSQFKVSKVVRDPTFLSLGRP